MDTVSRPPSQQAELFELFQALDLNELRDVDLPIKTLRNHAANYNRVPHDHYISVRTLGGRIAVQKVQRDRAAS